MAYQDSPSRYLPHGRYQNRLPFVTPEERFEIETRQLEETSSSSSGSGDCEDCRPLCSAASGKPSPSTANEGLGATVQSDPVTGAANNTSDVNPAHSNSQQAISAAQTEPGRLSSRDVHADVSSDLDSSLFKLGLVEKPTTTATTSTTTTTTTITISRGKGKESAVMSDYGTSAGDPANPANTAVSGGNKNATLGLRKVKKQKVLLMGKSGSGKSSMRSIIFSNYLARDTRRLGATIDIDLSHVKFLGNLTLNLWDCGGQEAFMENYLSQQRAHVFSNVGVLIYVFDIESHDVDRELATYVNITSALFQYSREAKIFVLVHKMDLIQPSTREEVFDARVDIVRKKTAEALAIVRKQKPDMVASSSAADDDEPDVEAFATSIWDQSLYKAWASIIHDLVPNLSLIEQQLASLGVAIDAEEILLFERTSFLVVSKWTSTEGENNPFGDRFERLSNILKSWKHTCSKFTGTPRNAEQFTDFEYKAGANFAIFITKFTTNTYILVCMPPGEARFNSARLNVSIARSWFRFLDGPVTTAPPAAASSAAPGPAAKQTPVGGAADSNNSSSQSDT